MLACQRYIELSLVRANMVERPAEYRWSSYQTHAQDLIDELIKPHESYQRLGSDGEKRQKAYRKLFRYGLDPGLIDEIRKETNGN